MTATNKFLFCLTVVFLLLEGCRKDPHMKLPSPDELKNLPSDGGADYNRLVFEQSPYLLQHAANPVDWYPWGEEAFEKAKKEDKPIFLSIGYATCHWCHVMEHESFEDSAVAAMMNEHFVCIKVDREERPDIDQIYMTVTQAMTGHGGWPMTVLMTWDRKPFFSGTYFPKLSAYGRTGMMDLIPAISEAWKNRRDEITKSADEITRFMQNSVSAASAESLTDTVLKGAFDQFTRQFDPPYAGFGNSPKFPTPHNLSFLLRYWKRTENSNALMMVEKTLKAMRMGGMYDQIGFGFHRYSTDAKWLVPHFEKMLYDQAMISIAYTEAYQATGKESYKKTAEEIFEYVLRDLTDPEGGFYSAEDADSEGEEGKFYLWSVEELVKLLGKQDADFISSVFNATSDGNYFDEASQHAAGVNIFHLSKDTDVLAYEHQMKETEFVEKLDRLRKTLFEEREKRIHPFKDDKILTDWNGLMIAALAKGAQAFNEPRYSDAAKRAADFILTKMRNEQGRLLKRWRTGRVGQSAHLDDYTMLTWGLLELYEATFDLKYLQSAIEINNTALDHFWDKNGGGFYFTADDGEALLTRMKEIYDGAVPSGNSVAVLNLLRLSRITGDESLAQKASQIGKNFSKNIQQAPMLYAQFLCGLDFALGPTKEIVIAGESSSADTQEMIATMRALFIPNKIVLLKSAGASEILTKIAPFTEHYVKKNDQATVYVCENYACKAPTFSMEEFQEMLKDK